MALSGQIQHFTLKCQVLIAASVGLDNFMKGFCSGIVLALKNNDRPQKTYKIYTHHALHTDISQIITYLMGRDREKNTYGLSLKYKGNSGKSLKTENVRQFFLNICKPVGPHSSSRRLEPSAGTERPPLKWPIGKKRNEPFITK